MKKNENVAVEAKVETVAAVEVVEKFDREKLEAFKTTSAKVRYLDSCNVTRGQIAKILNIRYQWVRNVLIQPVTTPKEKIA
ncbi:MAG: hypothetical protein ACRDBG_23565 [Waterburya sp.]